MLTEDEVVSIMAALIFAGCMADSQCFNASHEACVRDALKIRREVRLALAKQKAEDA